MQDEHSVGFVPEPTGRGTLGLAWSCLLTLIICIWSSLHPDVPAEGSTDFKILRSKFYMAFIAFLSPELIVADAVIEFLSAWKGAQKINALHKDILGDSDRDYRWPLKSVFCANMGGLFIDGGQSINAEGIIQIMQKHRTCLRPPCSKDISDKSKADTIGKLLACLQATWLLLQSCARITQHLPLSTLELCTVSYVILTLTTYALLWKKPVGIQTRTRVVALRPESVDLSRFRLPEIRKGRQRIFGDHEHFQVQVGAVILVSLLFGGWHCLAWNFSFPTVAEKQFWRVSAILGTITLPFFFLLAWLSEQTGSRSAILNGMAGSMLPLYLVARLVMIAEMFGGLRKMPARVYETVRWTDFIPQFS